MLANMSLYIIKNVYRFLFSKRIGKYFYKKNKTVEEFLTITVNCNICLKIATKAKLTDVILCLLLYFRNFQAIDRSSQYIISILIIKSFKKW